jgi:hypothetical protein
LILDLTLIVQTDADPELTGHDLPTLTSKFEKKFPPKRPELSHDSGH